MEPIRLGISPPYASAGSHSGVGYRKGGIAARGGSETQFHSRRVA